MAFASILVSVLTNHLTRIMNPDVKALLRERKRLLQKLSTLSILVRGTVVRGEKKCGRKTCKCQQGQLHRHVVISTQRHGKSHIVYVPKQWDKHAADAVDAYAQARRIIERISDINLQLFKQRKL